LPDHKKVAPGQIWLPKSFGDLNVRPKFMVLHNLFFLILAASVYLALIPTFESRVAIAKSRELSLLTRLISEDRPLQLPGLEAYNFNEGTADALGIPAAAREWMELHPGQVYRDTGAARIYRLAPATGQFRSMDAPNEFYDEVVQRAKITLFIVLGLLYCLAILLLELVIMPRYVYGPIRRFLDADVAIQTGQRDAELIPERVIYGDEIGQIMRSRNATVEELRQQERNLEEALEALEVTAEELKTKNSQLEAAKASLEEQDRLASLGLLSASVAHELNTPLAVLQGSIEKLSETIRDSLAQERLARMRRVAQRLKKISESLVDFARQRKREMEVVPLRPLVDEAWSLVAIDEKSSQVTFRNCVQPGAPVYGNADRLIQVFVNLLRNSLNAVDSEGTITVGSQPMTENGRRWTSISVEDNGPGIPAEVLPDIFEAFVTTRLDSRGTGLGLTVAEGIVTQHGGQITASNRKDGGARLEIKIPAAD
jgi:signal transduction histidine kinase